MSPIFKDRSSAGKYLATKLMHYGHRSDVIVLGLPRGGIPIGFEIAEALAAPLDVFIVRKLGAPGREELAIGALASGGVRVLNQEIVQRLGIRREMIDAIAAREQQELIRRERVYRGDRPPLQLKSRTSILVDDGLATGATMRAAVAALGEQQPARIVVAVPVGASETCELLKPEVDELVCAATPEPFFGVGQWYEEFPQLSDEEVTRLLETHWCQEVRS